MTVLKKILIAIILIALITAGFVFYGQQALTKPMALSQDEIITVNSGESVSSFSRKLVKKGWIETRFWIRNYARFNKELTQLKAGTYKVISGSSVLDVVYQIVRGEEHQYQITFIEGSTFKEWLASFNQHPQFSQFEKFATTEQGIKVLAKQLGIKQTNPEGQFFPDTYSFTAQTKPLKILKQAQQTMNDHLQTLWQNRDKKLPYKNAYQALIMASIIEKETGQISEQSTIASVFVNRLRKKMRLQTDPTVIYGLGDRYQGDITYAHLREKTAYNTYKINGLPPTPIAMPGLSALKAAFNPEKTDYLYFVSKGNGHHKFSKTLAEHNKAVRKYILKR